jgi:hypothetical protein
VHQRAYPVIRAVHCCNQAEQDHQAAGAEIAPELEHVGDKRRATARSMNRQRFLRPDVSG